MFVCEGETEWRRKEEMQDRLPCICWSDDKDGGQRWLGYRFKGLFGRLRLPHLLLKPVKLSPQPRYDTVFGHVMFCAVATLTCKASGTTQRQNSKKNFLTYILNDSKLHRSISKTGE